MEHLYTIEIKDMYYFTIDQFVKSQEEAVIFEWNAALQVKQKILHEKETAVQALGEDFSADDIVITPFLPELMRKYETIPITEVCPNCGKEIAMRVPKGTEKINFCPHCGYKNVYLCSECMEEVGACRPSAHCAYCHGHPND